MGADSPSPETPPSAPVRPVELAHGRWLGDFDKLSAVEQRLVDHCAEGEILIVDDERPEQSTSANRIRGGLIRFLLLGGDDLHPVHEQGVMIEGAWIAGPLDLEYTHCRVRLDARHCHFDESIIAIAAHIPELALSGSAIPGLRADRLKVNGAMFLREGFTSSGEIRLLGAEIGGDLSLTGAKLSGDAIALNADRIRIKGTAFFTNGFDATGEVWLLGAEIGGNVECSGGHFANPGGTALNLDGARIGDALFLREAKIVGMIDVMALRVGTLLDDRACYAQASVSLDGFRYDQIIGPTNAAFRVDWLRRQPVGHLGADFRPQPWEQLITSFREMGHPAEAAEIAIAKQEALRNAGRIGQRLPNPAFSGWRRTLDRTWCRWSNMLARWFHWFYGWIAGYGHRPARIIWRSLLVCSLFSLAFYAGRVGGLIGPASPPIQLSAALEGCGTRGDGAAYWTSPDCPMPPEYSTFQPFFYSLDVILPLIDLHQEAEWAPIVINADGETLWGGRALRWIVWFEILFGWVASLMFVAIVGRLVDRD